MINTTLPEPLMSVKWDKETPPWFDHFEFETADFAWWTEYMAINWKYPVYASAIYIFTIFSIQNYMRDRKPFSLRLPLLLWNAVLGIFSIMGFCRIFPEFWKVLQSENGFHKSVCAREGLNQPLAFWSLAFSFSKFIELGDSLFIVLRKQPLIFLQWYHHCTAMFLAWSIVPMGDPIIRWFGAMNYGIHGLMYSYFALKAMKIYIPRKVSMVLTTLQLAQMFVGFGLNNYKIYMQATGQLCVGETSTLIYNQIVYGSYIYLFGDFMYTAYFNKKTKKL